MIEAGWNIIEVRLRPDINTGFFDGVLINTYSSRYAEGFSREEMAEEEKSGNIADTLIKFLEGENWQAHRMFADEGELEHNTIKITVGFKPNPYFRPQWVKDLEKRLEKLEKLRQGERIPREELKKLLQGP